MADNVQMTVEVVSDLGELEKYGGDWNRLALAAPQKMPMITHAWVASFFEHRLNPGQRWVCLFAREAGNLIGVFPMVIRPGRLVGRRGPVLSTPYDWHTFGVDILTNCHRTEQVNNLFLAELDRVAPGWLSLQLQRLPESSPTLATAADSPKGIAIVLGSDGAGSYLDIKGSYEEYLAGLSHNFRRNLKKSTNRLGKLSGVQVTKFRGGEATEAHLQSFIELENAGWKGRAGSSIKSSPQLTAFYSTLVRRLAEAGWLEWAFLTADGKTIAGKMNVRFGDCLVMCKIAYDEEYAAVGPSNILIQELFKEVYADGKTTRVNFLTDMPWHQNWNTSRFNYYSLWLYPRRPASLLAGYIPRWTRTRLQQTPVIGSVGRGLRDLIRR